MQRGELDGQMVGLSSVRTGQRQLWSSGAFRPLMAFGRAKRHAEFPDMPTGRELTSDPGALALIEFAELPFFMACRSPRRPMSRPIAPRLCRRRSPPCAAIRASSRKPRSSAST
jgi:hypothetical protein